MPGLPNHINKNHNKIFESGFTLIEITIVVAVIALISAIAIPALLRARMVANDAIAKATLRSIDNAIGMYMIINSSYPASEADLVAPNASPPYLNRAYNNQTIRGFTYNYDFSSGYSVTATPQDCNKTGTKIFTLTQTVITESNCE